MFYFQHPRLKIEFTKIWTSFYFAPSQSLEKYKSEYTLKILWRIYKKNEDER